MKTRVAVQLKTLSMLSLVKSYLNGMYRFFEKNDIDEWNDIVGDCFPKYKDTFSVLSYDWMGRIFALEKKTNMVILFEPGTGDVYDTDADIIKIP